MLSNYNYALARTSTEITAGDQGLDECPLHSMLTNRIRVRACMNIDGMELLQTSKHCCTVLHCRHDRVPCSRMCHPMCQAVKRKLEQHPSTQSMQPRCPSTPGKYAVSRAMLGI